MYAGRGTGYRACTSPHRSAREGRLRHGTRGTSTCCGLSGSRISCVGQFSRAHARIGNDEQATALLSDRGGMWKRPEPRRLMGEGWAKAGRRQRCRPRRTAPHTGGLAALGAPRERRYGAYSIMLHPEAGPSGQDPAQATSAADRFREVQYIRTYVHAYVVRRPTAPPPLDRSLTAPSAAPVAAPAPAMHRHVRVRPVVTFSPFVP